MPRKKKVTGYPFTEQRRAYYMDRNKKFWKKYKVHTNSDGSAKIVKR